MIGLQRPLTSAAESDNSSDGVWSWLDRVPETLGHVGITILASFVLWFIGRVAIRAIQRGIRKGVPTDEQMLAVLGGRGRKKSSEAQRELELKRREQRARTVGLTLMSTWSAIVIAGTLISILSVVGVPVGPLIASAGIVGVALGFGAQSLVKDTISGMFLLIEDQYGVGDSVDLGEASGTVEFVGLRTTQLRSLDGTLWYVPNGEIRRVGNKTRHWSRAVVEARFTLDTDLDEAKQSLLDAFDRATQEPAIKKALLSPPDVAGIEDMGPDYYMVRLMVRVTPSQQWLVQRAIREALHDLFAERDLQFAPNNTVYMNAASAPAKTNTAGRKKASQPRNTSATKDVDVKETKDSSTRDE